MLLEELRKSQEGGGEPAHPADAPGARAVPHGLLLVPLRTVAAEGGAAQAAPTTSPTRSLALGCVMCAGGCAQAHGCASRLDA